MKWNRKVIFPKRTKFQDNSMKLKNILNEFGNVSNWASFGLASGRFSTSGYGSINYFDIDKTTQLEIEFDLLELMFDGWKPEEELTYTTKNRVRNLIQAGIAEKDGDVYFLTDLGKRWMKAFKDGTSDDIFKTLQGAATGSVAGVATASI